MSDMTGGFERAPAHARNRLEYKIYFGIVFGLSLPIAVASRLLPKSLPDADRTSVVGEAKRMTNTVIPYIFMH